MNRNEVHQHPDDAVFVRTPDGTYSDTVENFKRDFGLTLPPLPDGADDHVYTQGVRHAFHNSETGNLIAGGEMPWPLGDELIARVQEGLTVQAKRRAAEEAEVAKEQDEVMRESRRRSLDDIRRALADPSL